MLVRSRARLVFVFSILFVLQTMWPLGCLGSPRASRLPGQGSVVLAPLSIDREGLEFHGHEGLILVPENRAVPESRRIAVHFMVFPAKKDCGLDPVFYLPGGPGSAYTVRHFYECYGGERAKAWTTELEALRQCRDLVIVNQRGNPKAPGLTADLRWIPEPKALDEAGSQVGTARSYRETVRSGVEFWEARGIDLAGYDILNIVDDLEDLRIALGYERIALRGSSFGSQWALGYMKRWPARVDRALLDGVEPLSHGYDSPRDVYRALQRREKRALSDSLVAATLPQTIQEQGLLSAYFELATQLDYQPVVVTLRSSDEDSLKVTLGGFDLRQLVDGSVFGSRREALEAWPSFVGDAVAGDLRIIASEVAEYRSDTIGDPMIGLLIDRSLGVSPEREALLNEEAAALSLGEINLEHVTVKDLLPTPVVDASFRSAEHTEIPVLMIQGDLDLSTPWENASELLESFENGHLLTVVDGTHSAFRELLLLRPEISERVIQFFEQDFEKLAPQEFYESLPTRVELPKLQYRIPGGSPLFDEYSN